MTPSPARPRRNSRTSAATLLTLAVLVGDRIYDRVNDFQQKPNGHSEVRPQDAMAFWDLQQGMSRAIIENREENRRRFDEVLGLLREKRGGG